MPTVQQFYDLRRVTLPFWAFGLLYTIIRYRHIGIDIGTNRQPVDVPALLGGRVVRVSKTRSMNYVIVLRVGLLYYSYCHMSGDRLPKLGQKIAQGERVGRLAAGPKTLPQTDVDFPGTAWGGIHLHLVISNDPDGAYTYPRRTATEFHDPEPVIRSVLALLATLDAKPFPIPAPTPTKRKKKIMLIAKNTAKPSPQEYLLFGDNGAIQIFTGEFAARGFEAQIGAPASPVGQSFINAQIAKAGGIRKVSIVNADEIGGVSINVTGQK